MEQENGSICAPVGFFAAGTYSGVCNCRIQLDLAMILSQNDCSIVMESSFGNWQHTGRVLLYHNGLALPPSGRGNEITAEVCKAAAEHTNIPAQAVSLAATGISNQYFRPSLLINSISTLTASLSPEHDHLVERVMQNGGDIVSGAVSLSASGSSYTLGGIMTEEVQGNPGMCLMTTDMAVTPQQIQQAIRSNKDCFDLQGYTIIVMANGMAAAGGSNSELLVQAMRCFMAKNGIHAALKECS